MVTTELLQTGTRMIVRVTGSVDLSNVSTLRSAIDDAVARSPKGFIIDLSAVDYIDSEGVSALVYAYRQMYPIGGKLALVVAETPARRTIALTRLETLPGISVCDDIESAEQAL